MTRAIDDTTAKRQIIRFLPVKDYPSLAAGQKIDGTPAPNFVADYLGIPLEQVERVLPTIRPDERFG
jgi:hypothetical protein